MNATPPVAHSGFGAGIACVAYLIAEHGASRLEAVQVITRIRAKPIPADLTASLDILDTELTALREESHD